MADFELCESFGIDDGQLDDFGNTKCFVLGVEWAQIKSLADKVQSGEIFGFEKPVHSVNVSRLENILKRREIPYAIAWLNDDWNQLIAGDRVQP